MIENAVIDALDNGVIVLDGDARIVGWNAWLAASSGVSANDAMGKALADLFPEANLNRVNASVRAAFTSGASSLLTHSLNPYVLPLKTRTGRQLAHTVSIRPIGQKPYDRCLVQIADVTDANHRERVLRERQNARYDAVVDSAPDAILTLDDEGAIQLANPAAARQFGYDAQELMGRNIGLLFPEPDVWTNAWEFILNAGSLARPVEMVARRKDGSPSYLEISAARWSSNSRVFVTAILRDVNERRAAERALRRLNETLEQRVATALAQRKFLADIVESTDALIQAVGLDYKLLAVNKASADQFERLYGVRPRPGDNVLDLLSPWPAEQAEAKLMWDRALAGEEFTLVRSLGEPASERRFFEHKLNVLRDGAGQQIAAFQFVYDVTERIEHQERLAETEEALRQSQKMEAIGQLTGGIAHDFNNLLTGIIGAMDILRRRLAAGRYEDTQRFMDAAVASANRAAALTHRLLAFARRQPLAPKPVDVNNLVHGMEDMLRRAMGEQIRLVIAPAGDLWPTLTDPNQLENALLNLGINARDAMAEGGKLTVATRNVTFERPVAGGQEEIEAGDYTVIDVADTGMGMSPEVLTRVFEPFFTTKPLGQGTGLGLSMIYGFARQSRGYVRIESAEGVGTTVSLYLPRYRGALLTEGVHTPRQLPKGDGETVLLVEDDSSVRLLIGEVLRDLGYACIEANDGQAALPILTSNARLDLMISDIGLPGLNGRQLAQIARQHRPELKILFVTGYAEHATGQEKFLEAGMEMVTKPFALDALALKIREIIREDGA